MIQAAVFTDTLHVENIHQPNLLHTRNICPLSRLQKNTHKHPNDRPDGAKWRKPKNNIFSPLSPASSQWSLPSPDMHGAHGDGFPLISSSPPGNQHFNNSLSAGEGVWCFYAHHHPSSFLSLISQHPSESEAKSSLGLRRTCLSCLFYKLCVLLHVLGQNKCMIMVTCLLDCIVRIHKSQHLVFDLSHHSAAYTFDNKSWLTLCLSLK